MVVSPNESRTEIVHRKQLYRITLPIVLENSSHLMLYYFFKQPCLSQVSQRSTVVLAPIKKDIIDNDVAPSHLHRRIDSRHRTSTTVHAIFYFLT